MDDIPTGLSKEDVETWNLFVEKLNESDISPPPKFIYGEEPPSRRLDLHGMTIHDAWMGLREFVEAHQIWGTKEVVVITGRSGRICHEFTEWCRRLYSVKSYEPIETKSGKVGSYRLRLRTA